RRATTVPAWAAAAGGLTGRAGAGATPGRDGRMSDPLAAEARPPMKIVLFCHSLVSDWNHGNAHFLRGIATELLARGHRVEVYEPEDGWSAANLAAEEGAGALAAYREAYPELTSHRYRLPRLELDRATDGADLVLVHEWNEPLLVAALGAHRAARGRYRLLFHDTHHRSVSDPRAMAAYDLDGYDGVLAFGEAVRQRYLAAGWARRAWTWHEAADVRVFRPRPETARRHDLVWIGNWGDDERTAELAEFLFEPARRLRLSGHVHGVRYPAEGRAAVEAAGLTFAGYLPNHRVPEVFAAHRVTVHVPRRFYVDTLPGVPTIRVFEALACGIPLVSAPWPDAEGLFRPGDFLLAADGAAMRRQLAALLHDDDLWQAIARQGRDTVLARHTCAHRVDELFAVLAALDAGGARATAPETAAGAETRRPVEVPG
ncbi:MAG TPA: glycosyltransferase, partial [Thermoanaerobaculia bacterium]|nr:glycosyltransferase [Thermoanaerobaculia bacterium]